MASALPLYFKSIGFNNTQIGFILSLSSLTSMIFMPIWGHIDDMKQISVKLIRIIMLSCSILFFLYSVTDQFIIVLIIRILFYVFLSGNGPILDKIAMNIQVRYNVPFPRMRMFVALGFATILLPVMFYIDNFNNYQIIFYIVSLNYLIAFMLTKRLYASDHVLIDANEKNNKTSIKVLLSNKAYLILVLIYMIAITTSEISGNFQSIHLLETLKAPYYSITLSVLVGSGLSEISMFLLSIYIIKRSTPSIV